jgi:16S rRNA (adenine1518-N6/adenine1519-N6)-dimethyltransferase
VDRLAVPRTHAEIRRTLKALALRPSRRLGQSFLADPGVLARIVAAAAPRSGDLVLEVGPGLGCLTEAIVATGASVLAVEIDPVLAAFVRAVFVEEPRVRVLEADALDGRGGLAPELIEALAAAVQPGRFLFAANLPYSAATPLVLALLQREPPPDEMVIMVQREVADRIRATPGTKAFGPLSVLVQAVARVKTVATVRKESFHPEPEVASTVLRVTPDAALRRAAGDLSRLEALVHGAFSMRRKTLGNNLGKAGVAAEAVRAAGIDPGRRAETLSPAEFIALAAALPSLASQAGGGEDPPSRP